jgi:peptide/nickel transport system permease protein
MKPGLFIGACLLAVVVAAAIVGPFFAPYDPDRQDLDHALEGPSPNHWLGTDENGCDLLSQVLHGARLAVMLAAAAVSLSMLIGVTLGSAAGYAGGIVDDIVMRVCDVLLAFPGILLNLAILAVVQRPGVGHLLFALCVNGWVGYARLARAQALGLRERDFVTAARAQGLPGERILFRHVVPNLLGPAILQATFGFAGVVLIEASLSFLGLGPGKAYSWGSLMSQGATYLWQTQRLATVPGLCIAAVVLGCNLLGDALRDRLDPRRRLA